MKSYVILLVFFFHNYCKPSNIENYTSRHVWSNKLTKNDLLEIFLSSPACKKNSTILHHDGMSGNGDRIMIGTSKKCNEMFTFPVDSSMRNLYILIDSLGFGYPTGELYDPSNNEVMPCSDQNIENYGYIASYCNIFSLNGGGYFQYSISSFDNYPCSLSIFSDTTIVSDGGFINDLTSDNVQDILPIGNEGIQKIPIIGEASYFAFQMTGLSNSYGPQKVKIKSNTGNTFVYNVEKRINCSANNYIGPFTCTTNGYNALFINGKDDNGYDFERFYTFNCKNNIIPTTQIPPTYLPPIDKCFNNGTLIKPPSSPEFCSCPKYYTGKQCENKLCFNDGTLGPDDECICMNYWSGEFCQNMICSDLADHDDEENEKAFTFIIRTTTSILSYKYTILEIAREILSNYILNKPSYFVKFVIVTVANGEIRYINEMDDVNDFYEAIKSLEYFESNSCLDSLEEALITALQTNSLLIYTKSPIFVFSDALSDDSEEIKGQLLNNIVYFQGPIFFILLKSNTLNCPIDTSNNDYKNLFHISQMSQGLVSRVDNENDTFNLVTKIGSYIYDIGTLLQNDFSDSCNYAPKYQAFFVDDSIKSFTLLVSSNNAHFDIFDSNRLLLVPVNITNIGDTKLLFFNSTTIGNYELQALNSDAGPCQYRIFAETKYKLFFGVSTRIIEDVDYRMTIYNNDYNLVSKFKKLIYPNDTDNLLIESLIWTNDEKTGLRKILYGSNGKFRNGCSYHLFFGSWKCLSREMKFYINVIVSDGMGNIIQRTKSGFCAAFNPTPIPPSGCQNGGVEGYNGTCVCTEGYTGDKCQYLICQNDGVSKNGYCECRGGYAGKFCEVIECTEKNTNNDFPKTKKSLTFLLHESMTTRTMVNSLLEYSYQMIRDINSQKKDFISFYQLITFNDNSSKIYVDSSNPNDFVNGLQNLSDTLMNDEGFSCNYLNLYEAMHKVLFDPNTSQYGYFYVFINGIPLQDVSTFTEAKNFLELLNIQLNIVQVSGAPCGYSISNSPEMASLLEIVSSTDGSFYNVEPILSGNVLKTISSQYSSQTIYENYFEDCSSNSINLNFPIDSKTQTVTINILGNLIHDPLYIPPNNDFVYRYNFSLISSIYNDYAYGNRVDRIVRACDDNWINYDSYCWLLVDSKVSWEESKKSCNDNNANLATIYNKNDKRFLENYLGDGEFWIGLNDIQRNGTFVWDQGNLNSSSLSRSSFVDWIPKQPNLKYQCVYNNINVEDKNNNGWITGDCLEKKYYVCVKHVYDSKHTSTHPNNNQLPKGLWNLKLQTTDGSCHIKITSQTDILLYSAFSQNKFDDFGLTSPSQGNDIFNYMLVHSIGLEDILEPNNEGKLLNFMMFPQNNMTLVGMGNIIERDGCLYQYVSTKFICPYKNFRISITGVDRFGYSFQRLLPITCPSINIRGECKNGGVPMANSCFCSLFWTGNNCDIIQCLYGKPNYNFQKCICNDGYIGDHCTIAVCTRKNGNNTSELDNNNKAFILAIDGEGTGEMEDILNNIEELLTNVFDEAEYIKKNKFTRFIGVVFRDSTYLSGGGVSDIFDTTDKRYFISRIKSEIIKNPYKSTTNVNSRLILTALIKVLSNSTIPPLSQAYVITNSNAEDYDKIEDALYRIGYKHTKVDIIIIGDENLPGNVSFNDNEINSLFKIAYTSGGNFYQVPNYLALIDFWNSLLITEIGTYTTTKKLSTHCKDTIEYIQMSSKGTLLVLDVYSLTESVIKILDPNNNEVEITGEIRTKTNSLILIRKTESQLIPGVWKVKLLTEKNSDSFCHVSARILEDNPPHIAFNPDVAEDGGRHSDYSTQYTTANYEKNAIVAATPFGILKYVQIHDITGTELLWSSSLISREKCGFKYITKDLFFCKIPTFVISINGIDDDGHAFRMIQTIYCYGHKNLQ